MGCLILAVLYASESQLLAHLYLSGPLPLWFFFSAAQMWKKSKNSCPHSPATCCPYSKLGTFCFRPGTSISCHHHFTSYPDLMVTFPCTFQPSHYINLSLAEQDPNPHSFIHSSHSTNPDDSLLELCCCSMPVGLLTHPLCVCRIPVQERAWLAQECPSPHVTAWALCKSCTPAVVVLWMEFSLQQSMVGVYCQGVLERCAKQELQGWAWGELRWLLAGIFPVWGWITLCNGLQVLKCINNLMSFSNLSHRATHYSIGHCPAAGSSSDWPGPWEGILY